MYKAMIFVMLLGGCAANPFNLKQGEFLRYKGEPVSRRGQLPIALDATNVSAQAFKAFIDAANWINDQAGCNVFSEPTFQETGKVVRLFCAPGIVLKGVKGRVVGVCENHFNPEGEMMRSDVTIYCSSPFPKVHTMVAAHELMHALGFAHDREIGTLMYPYVHRQALHLQDADLELLQAMCSER